jgi:hypothetical protein
MRKIRFSSARLHQLDRPRKGEASGLPAYPRSCWAIGCERHEAGTAGGGSGG